MKTINKTIQPDINTPMPIDFYINDLNLASRTTMWRWTRQGLRTTRVGGRVYVSQGDMQDFMANQDEGGEK
tara:strand:+ start:2044 stop:2256 length:213 start_codon:yes stop_codon:yes gene_type:complete